MKVKNSALVDLILSYQEKERLYILLDILINLSEQERRALFKKVFSALPIRERKKLSTLLTGLTISNARWSRINNWMEKTLTNNFSLTPYRVAMIGMNYFRMNRKMKPFMIALARKVKARVRYRLNGSNTKADTSK
ncbi:hypothetical protein V4D30_01135 [Thermodesulfovibrio sp. 3907-1M]|uniref:Uncharacterized protein n=1 Tax=Thermodesulfovibrio autotrophicus TaxID=3118333 RepID=A0AAU8GWA2_9BACT